MKRIICLFLICVLLTGCSSDSKTQRDLFVMDTVVQLQIWGEDADAAADDISAMLRSLERTWSATDESSALSIYNEGGDPGWTAEEAALLERIDALSARTGGAFDPTLYALTDAFGFYDDDFRIPTEDEIAVALEDDRMDLGGALKGYAGQQAVAVLERLDIHRAILDLGGNIQTYGSKADGSPWQIGIQAPDGGTLVTVSVEGTVSIVTSGDYQRYFEADGVRYHHILDPETGYPADSGLRSVTVICRDGLTADVFSTALFVMGLEEGIDFWRQSDDFEAVFLLTSGKVYATEGASLSGCDYEVIRREK